MDSLECKRRKGWHMKTDSIQKRAAILIFIIAIAAVFSACSNIPASQTKTEPSEPETTEAVTEAVPEGAPEMKKVSGDNLEQTVEFILRVNDSELNSTDLAGLDLWEAADVEITDSKGISEKVSFIGYRISDILKAADCPDTGKLTFLCSDGYESEYEVTAENATYTLLAVEKNGEAAESGVFFAPCLEHITSYYLKDVVSIKAE